MKKCNKCGTYKSFIDFYKRTRHNDGLTYTCRECINEANLRYRRTKKGLIGALYRSQTNSSIARDHPKPLYTLKQLKEWIFSQPNFESLYNKWVISGYEKNLRPSVDRLNDNKGYSFSNIQLVSWQENNNLAYSRRRSGITITKQNRPVLKLDMNGNIIKEYASVRQAQRENKITHITEACKKEGKTSGDYLWKYKTTTYEQ